MISPINIYLINTIIYEVLMQQEDDFNFWLDECRNYGLRVTRDRLIKSLYEFDDFAYQFAMSPDSKTMIVLLEREVFNDDV
jgi:hypothetical protein